MKKVNRDGNKVTLLFTVLGDIRGCQLCERLTLENPDRDLTDLDFTLSREILGSFDGKGLTWGNVLTKEYVTFARVTSQLDPDASATEIAQRYRSCIFFFPFDFDE